LLRSFPLKVVWSPEIEYGGEIMEEKIVEVIKSLIYHGRHFSPKRDDIVIQKALEYLVQLLSTVDKDDPV